MSLDKELLQFTKELGAVSNALARLTDIARSQFSGEDLARLNSLIEGIDKMTPEELKAKEEEIKRELNA
jgi:hypothetical protein